MTRHGLKSPTSGLRAGFGNPMNCYIWRMCVHAGTLYVGTCDISSFVPFSSTDTWPDHVKRLLDTSSMERFLDRLGGCELWRTTDGDNWLPVTRNGFDNRYNLGIRALVSTPHGLFVGTANPFGPRVAVRDGDGWRYQDNPRGGLEMWLGSHRQPDPQANAADSSPATPSVHSNGRAALPSVVAEDGAALTDNYRLLERQVIESERARNPFLRLASTPTDLLGLSESAEIEIAEYFRETPRNVGYWARRSLRPVDACRALAAENAAILQATAGVPDTLCLVAWGAVALAAVVRERFPNCQITCCEPGDWPAMGHYDAAICLEACPQDGGPQFLSRLGRCLNPGATAIVSDYTWPDNFELASAAADAGLHLEEVRDVSANTWIPFFEHSRNYWLVKLLLQQIDSETHTAVLAALPGGNGGVKRYTLTRLKKSEEA